MLVINKNKLFKEILSTGFFYRGAGFTLKFIFPETKEDDNLKGPSFGIIVSKKQFKTAVLRNLVKRRLRAILRECLKVDSSFSGAYIFIGNKSILDSSFALLKCRVQEALSFAKRRSKKSTDFS